MAVSKQKKTEILDELKGIFDESSVLFLTTRDVKSSIGASVNYEYRSTLNNSKAKVMIAKNTLIRLALKEKGIELADDMVGQTYIQVIPGGDEVGVIKVTLDLVKDKFSDNFKVYGSVVGGKFMNASETEMLSKVPSFDQSMSMVAGALNSVISKIAIGVKEVPTSIARGVAAMSNKA